MQDKPSLEEGEGEGEVRGKGEVRGSTCYLVSSMIV